MRTHGPWKCHGADQFFILAPQCPKRRVWPVLVDEVLLVLEHVCKRDDVDKLRVCITGLSMGAFGAWTIAACQPQRFAAIVSVCGGFIGTEVPVGTNLAEMLRLGNHVPPNPSHHAALCKRMPAWLFFSKNDARVKPICSRRILKILKPVNKQVRSTLYHSGGHQIWSKAYNTLELYAWLLELPPAPS